MKRKRSRSKKRPLGPGVVERPAPDEDDLVLTRDGLRRSRETRGGPALEAPRPSFDSGLPRAHSGGGYLVSQVVVERGRTAIVDVVVPVTRRVSAWHCYARSRRGRTWRGASRDGGGRGLTMAVGRSTVHVRGSGPTAHDSDVGELAWRFTLDNVPSAGTGSDVLARIIVTA